MFDTCYTDMNFINEAHHAPAFETKTQIHRTAFRQKCLRCEPTAAGFRVGIIITAYLMSESSN